MGRNETKKRPGGNRPFRLGDWTVSPETCRLHQTDREVRLEPRSMVVLEYLAARPGDVVTRQELEESIWTGTVVGYKAVTNVIIKLRKALSDDARCPRYIETISKHGYRLIAEVGDLQSQPATVSRQSIVELTDEPSIAILPFTNMSGDAEQEYFSDGITEDIITELARFPHLMVIARHSSFAFKGAKVGIREVAEKLGVQYVLEGSVRKAANRVRITAQLVDADTGNHIWTERYDRDIDDIFAVQDDVTRAMVATLTGQLEKSVVERARRKAPENVNAYDCLLRGIASYHRFSARDATEALRLFERAVELDPGFARAYAWIADVYNAQSLLDWDASAEGKGLAPARHAVELDSNDYVCRSALAWALYDLRRWEEAESEFDRVLELKPGDAQILVYTGNALLDFGRGEEGVALIEEAIRLNPLHPELYRRFLGVGLYYLKRYEEAIGALHGGYLRDSWGYAHLAAAYAQLGRSEEAKGALAEFVLRRTEELKASGVTDRGNAALLGNYQKNYPIESQWDHFLDGLRKAGLRE